MSKINSIVERVNATFAENLKQAGVQDTAADALCELLASDKLPKPEDLVTFYQDQTKRGEE